jgi:hypothetical protein
VPEMKGVTPILSAVAPIGTVRKEPSDRGGNPTVYDAVSAGKPQHMAWAYEREDGGRGFGFTGGHFHDNWGNDNFRKVVLNAMVWLAKCEVPAGGVESQVTEADLNANLDPKPAPKAKAAKK